jgi:hypothetical protein
MPATSVVSQLVGDEMLEHELGSIIFRCLRQLDIEFFYKDADDVWRHHFEVDFAVRSCF